MVRTLALALLLSLTASVSAQSFTDRAKAATAILYAQDAQGGLSMRCTATAFARDGEVYQFVSAAHCAGSDDTTKEKVAKAPTLYITFDERAEKVFWRAEVVATGYQHRGDDFLILSVTSSKDWPTIPIGDERQEAEGNAVLNIASPLGLGKQVFHGSISKLTLDRPVIEGDINWKGSVLLQMPGTDGGSSGSAVLSESQEAIVAFLVGTIGGSAITAIPASKFEEFRTRVADGKYRWMTKDEDQ
jgi:hypothetical protein